VAAIVVVVVVDDGSGGVGADNRCPMPPAAEGWPVDDVATVVVRFSPIVCYPARLLPILRAIVFIIVIVFVVVVVVIKKALPTVFPPLPPLPLPSCHHPRLNASSNHSGSLDMYDPWSAHRMPIARSSVSSPDDNPVQTITSLGIAIAAVFIIIIADMGGGWEWDVGGRGESVLSVVLCGMS
jgi:hypothetical protein